MEGIGKLIELLNESAVLDTIFENEYQVKFKATKIISKELGFIKRLVDNDKIDRDKVLISFTISESDGLGNYYGHGVEDYQRILMLLAIQDSSIEYLIRILK